MIKSSRGGGGGWEALLSEFQLYRMLYFVKATCKGSARAPRAPSLDTPLGVCQTIPLKNLYACTYNLLDQRFLDSPLRAEIVKCTHITSV